MATNARPLTREAAAWVSALRYADIPPRVIALAKSQIASVLASAHAGALTAASKQVLEAVRRFAPAGTSPIVATGDRVHLDAALAANSALGMAQDYDDYLFMGHTGHSAVWVALLVGLETRASGEDVLAAVVAANEVAGRLGAACILGPQNGQLWTHIHLAGAAAAAGKLYGLSADQMAHAFGIAYAQPTYGLFPGFMGPGSKLLSAVTPSLTGLQAARYALVGMQGCTTIWEDEQGFLRHFAYRPIARMLSGWGEAWVTDTLAIKPYPGCAYIDTTIDNMLSLRAQIARERGRFDVADIEAIDVAASILTIEMDRLSARHFNDATLTPININFNIPVNVAIALLAGELGSKQLTEEYLTRNREAVLAAAAKVRLRHGWQATFDMLNDLDRTVGTARFFAGTSRDDVRYIRLRMKRDGHANLDVGRGEIGEVVRAAFGPGGLLRKHAGGLVRGLLGDVKQGAPLTLSGVDFAQVRLPFRSRVALRMKDGKEYAAERDLPRGSAAAGDVHVVAREKLERELRLHCPREAADAAWARLQTLESTGVGPLLAAVTPGQPVAS